VSVSFLVIRVQGFFKLAMPQVLMDWVTTSKTGVVKVFILIFLRFLTYLGFCVQKFEKTALLRGEMFFHRSYWVKKIKNFMPISKMYINIP
jgi:hypothetical protein